MKDYRDMEPSDVAQNILREAKLNAQIQASQDFIREEWERAREEAFLIGLIRGREIEAEIFAEKYPEVAMMEPYVDYRRCGPEEMEKVYSRLSEYLESKGF